MIVVSIASDCHSNHTPIVIATVTRYKLHTVKRDDARSGVSIGKRVKWKGNMRGERGKNKGEAHILYIRIEVKHGKTNNTKSRVGIVKEGKEKVNIQRERGRNKGKLVSMISKRNCISTKNEVEKDTSKGDVTNKGNLFYVNLEKERESRGNMLLKKR